MLFHQSNCQSSLLFVSHLENDTIRLKLSNRLGVASGQEGQRVFDVVTCLPFDLFKAYFPVHKFDWAYALRQGLDWTSCRDQMKAVRYRSAVTRWPACFSSNDLVSLLIYFPGIVFLQNGAIDKLIAWKENTRKRERHRLPLRTIGGRRLVSLCSRQIILGLHYDH